MNETVEEVLASHTHFVCGNRLKSLKVVKITCILKILGIRCVFLVHLITFSQLYLRVNAFNSLHKSRTPSRQYILNCFFLAKKCTEDLQNLCNLATSSWASFRLAVRSLSEISLATRSAMIGFWRVHTYNKLISLLRCCINLKSSMILKNK